MKTRPKKRFGQHFLRDTRILDRIINHLRPGPCDTFLEVGAGDGALSRRLAARVGTLVAVELDGDQIPLLAANLSPFTSAVVEWGDILTLDLDRLLSPFLHDGRSLRVAGNLPYNIATAIIERLFSQVLPVADMNFLVQLEVAQRITARPGSRQYGYFSVFCQHLSEVDIGLKIRPGAFSPPPMVMSAVVTLRPRRRAADPQMDDTLAWLTKAAFAHRRKTIAGSFRFHSGLAPIAEALLARAGIDGNRRAEQVSVEEFAQLARIYLDDFSQLH